MATSKANFYQPGHTLDYPNTTTAAIPANTIVSLISRVGVIGMDINPGEVGVVHVEGVFKMPKAAGVAVTMGQLVYFNVAAGSITTSASGCIPAGYAAAAAIAADSVVLVKLLG